MNETAFVCAEYFATYGGPIWGRLQHWLQTIPIAFDPDIVWIRRNFTGTADGVGNLDLAFFFTGCILWVAVYLIIVRNVRRYQFVEMPAIAAAGNLSWEFIWSFVYITAMGHLFVVAYRAWFFVDLFIYWSVLKYGHKQGIAPRIQPVFKPMVWFALFATGALWFTYVWGDPSRTDHCIGNATAYAGNLIISALYLFQLARLKDVRALSPAIAWLKMLGTGLITIFMFRVFDDAFIVAMGVICVILDIFYIVRLDARRREQAAGIPGVPALDDMSPIIDPAF